MSKTLKQLFDESRESWGIKSQLMMFVEEANEASVAAMHIMRRNKDTQQSLVNFAEELADLQFMLEEMIYYFKDVAINQSGIDASFFDAMVHFRKQKEAKLEHLLSNANEKTQGEQK